MFHFTMSNDLITNLEIKRQFNVKMNFLRIYEKTAYRDTVSLKVSNIPSQYHLVEVGEIQQQREFEEGEGR